MCLAGKAEGETQDAGKMLDERIRSMPASERFSLGLPLARTDHQLYGGQLVLRLFQKGFLAANRIGKTFETQVVLLTKPSPKAKPLGWILITYDRQGGRKTFGEPLEGEHSLFNDNFRYHVFRKAVLVWQRGGELAQPAIVDQPFQPD
jgi:hypothetical protein